MFDKLVDVIVEWIGLLKFWRVIPVNKIGVRIRLGRNPVMLRPGLHFIFPFEIDHVKACVIKPEWTSTNALHITTMDMKTVTVAPVLCYEIKDPIKWLYEANDAPTNLHDISRLCTSDVLTESNWDEYTKRPTWTKIKNKIKDKAEDKLGINILDFGLIDLAISRLFITQV